MSNKCYQIYSICGIRSYFGEPEWPLVFQHNGAGVSSLEVHRVVGLYGQLVPAAERT